ncbi:MAG: CRISPR-associated protein Cas6 [Planctomycetota bacterium]|jgi:CRISPR-associated protein Cas6
MFWQETQSKDLFQPPEDIFDLAFKVEGQYLHLDHAFDLALALEQLLGAEVCQNIGVHQIRMAESGNGWKRPEDDGRIMLSHRARLVIRTGLAHQAQVSALSGQSLQLGDFTLGLGRAGKRPLSTLSTLHSRAIVADDGQAEEDFLQQIAEQLADQGIRVSRMICGTSGTISMKDKTVFTRSLMIADLTAQESVLLQRNGIGEDQLLGCGLFIPHKGIDAVGSEQQK